MKPATTVTPSYSVLPVMFHCFTEEVKILFLFGFANTVSAPLALVQTCVKHGASLID